MSNLDNIREKIDRIDDQILTLLYERAQCVEGVKKVKTGIIYRPIREDLILKRLFENVKPPLTKLFIYHVWRTMITNTLLQEGLFNIGYLSPSDITKSRVCEHFCVSLNQHHFGTWLDLQEQLEDEKVTPGIVMYII